MPRNQHRESWKAKKEEYVQKKVQDKTSEMDLNEIEISDLPDKELKIIKLTKVRRITQSENFNEDTENISTRQKSQRCI